MSCYPSRSIAIGTLALAGCAWTASALAQSTPVPVGSPQEVSPQTCPHPESAFVAVVDSEVSSPDEWSVHRVEGPLWFPETGVRLWVGSLLDRDGNKRVVVLDDEGALRDLDAVRRAEGAAILLRRGKLSERLAGALAQHPRRLLPLVAWLAPPDVEESLTEITRRLSDLGEADLLGEEYVEHFQGLRTRAVVERIAPITRGFGETLRDSGIAVVHEDVHAPLVFFHASAEQAVAIASDSRVVELEVDDVTYGPRLSAAYAEIQGKPLYKTFPTATAWFAEVAIIEQGAPCAGPYLTVPQVRIPGMTSDHATAVASCVASTHGTHKGIARNARVVGANGITFQPSSTMQGPFQGAVEAISWSIDHKHDVFNLSFGAFAPPPTVSCFDKYLDWVARVHRRPVVVACGNGGNVGDPGAGYNQIAVGAFDHEDSPNWYGVGGAHMLPWSSWTNPNTGVETPQIAAPGLVYGLICSNGGQPDLTEHNGMGTSFAAPFVSGVASLLISRRTELTAHPNVVRAILMATAWHNIEGSALLSSKDGAGGLDALSAYRVADRGKGEGYDYRDLSSADFWGVTEVQVQTFTVKKTAEPHRVCLSWFSQVQKSEPYYGSPNTTYDSTLASDLDLAIYDPAGNLVAQSSSTLQPFELCWFKPAKIGTYRVKVRATTIASGGETIGVAVSRQSDATYE